MVMKADKLVVLTLDAGGTNFVFSAMQDYRQVVSPIRFPSNADNLEKCLNTLVSGFEAVINKMDQPPDAISFAFPGPADYSKGIIGDLPNLKAFRGGVPLGPFLEEKFRLPVFINNDGDLFAYSEALYGYLPEINQLLKDAGSIKQHRNLIGLTLGTGFGCGIVLDNKLLVGDNSCGAEIHNALNKYFPKWNAEESVSTRAIQRVYAEQSGSEFDPSFMPKEIYEIAKGTTVGNSKAALEAFRIYGENLGSSIANVLTFIDGVVVLGGGITAAWDLFAPAMFTELDREYEDFKGEMSDRLSYKVFNLEDRSVFKEYAKGNTKRLQVPDCDNNVMYDDIPRTGVGLSKLGTNKAVAMGAYAIATVKLIATK
jgi:glucokinase